MASVFGLWSQIKQLFSRKYLMISLSLSIQWFGIHMMSIGQIFILPIIQNLAKKGFGEMFLTFLGEVPGFILTYFIIERAFMGRKNSLKIFFLLCAISNFLAYFQVYFALMLFLSRLCYRQCHGVLYVITNEIYETPMRSTGIGIHSALGRLATVLMPFIIMTIYEADTYSPFLFFSFLAVICSFMAFKLPFDTTNTKLDHVDEELVNLSSTQSFQYSQTSAFNLKQTLFKQKKHQKSQPLLNTSNRN